MHLHLKIISHLLATHHILRFVAHFIHSIGHLQWRDAILRIFPTLTCMRVYFFLIQALHRGGKERIEGWYKHKSILVMIYTYIHTYMTLLQPNLNISPI